MDFKMILVLSALLALPAAYAASGGANGAQGQLLGAATAEAQCRVDFTVGYLNAISAAVPNASATLGADASALQADMATLDGYATSGDTAGYRSYLSGTMDPAFKAARNDVASRPWKGSGDATLSSLKASYLQLSQTLESCQLNAAKSFAQDKIAIYQQDIENYTSRTGAIAGRNGSIGTGGLNQILSDAQSQVIGPLQAAISSAGNASDLRAALDKYCLYDGCKNGENFHLAVKYGLARLTATLSSAQSRMGANGTNYFAKAQQDLSSAQSEMSAIGTSQYTDSSRGALQDSMKSFTRDLRQAAAQIAQARAAGRGMMNGTNLSRGFGPMMNGTIRGNGTARGMMNGTRGRFFGQNGAPAGAAPANPPGFPPQDANNPQPQDGNSNGGVGQ